MADQVHGVEVDAVSRGDPLQNDVEQGEVAQGMRRIVRIGPREASGSIGQRRRVDEDRRSVRRFLEAEVAARLAVVVGPAMEGENQGVSRSAR
jgi:hypothetical protein